MVVSIDFDDRLGLSDDIQKKITALVNSAEDAGLFGSIRDVRIRLTAELDKASVEVSYRALRAVVYVDTCDIEGKGSVLDQALYGLRSSLHDYAQQFGTVEYSELSDGGAGQIIDLLTSKKSAAFIECASGYPYKSGFGYACIINGLCYDDNDPYFCLVKLLSGDVMHLEVSMISRIISY